MDKLSLSATSPLKAKDFVFGVATSSFQIEGSVGTRDKNIWDTFCDKQGAIADASNGEPGCQHIEMWQQDVELISSLNVDAYRLSISWPRVIKENGEINLQGIGFYRELLSALKGNGIKTYVTLYHWDLPDYLEQKGGWLNRETVTAFKHYTEVVVTELEGLVDSYATLNEPWCSAYLGYEAGIHAPGKTGRLNGIIAAHHLLLAHGEAMKVLNEQSPHTENGLVLNFTPTFAATDSEKDEAAAHFAHQYFNAWYVEPVLKGSYPPHLLQSFVSQFDLSGVIQPGDLATISQPVDFIGVNYYTKSLFSDCAENGFKSEAPLSSNLTDMGWEIYPQGLTDILLWLKNNYDVPPIYITENGAAMPDQLGDGEVNDTDRVAYFQSHLNALENAIEQGVDVKGYFAWSLMDNFEWAEGYKKRFGIVWVDFDTQKRIIKSSGKAYQQMLASR